MQNDTMTKWEQLAQQIEQQEWRGLAASIAITVITFLNKHQMTKQQLAEKMGVKPQYVSRVVKGQANLTLDTIAKLERALDETIVTISDPTDMVAATATIIAPDIKWKSFLNFEGNPANTLATGTKKQPKAEYNANKENEYALAS